MGFADRIAGYRERTDSALERWLPPAATHPERFHTAVRYSVLGGGKRFRPILVYAAAEWLEITPERVDAIAVAVELVHAYSLVHHDLPAIDDRAQRRGRATTHMAFDDATAILAGDALQAHAYRVLASDAALGASAATRRQLLLDLAGASGSEGMAGGQAMEIAGGAEPVTPAFVEEVYARKTGGLLRAAAVMPCRLRANGGDPRLAAAQRYGLAVGLAFQVADHLLLPDKRKYRPTLPSLVGTERARERMAELRAEALAALEGFGGEADGLRWICDWAVTRAD